MISVRVFLDILDLSEKVQTWHTSLELAVWSQCQSCDSPGFNPSFLQNLESEGRQIKVDKNKSKNEMKKNKTFLTEHL